MIAAQYVLVMRLGSRNILSCASQIESNQLDFRSHITFFLLDDSSRIFLIKSQVTIILMAYAS
jgi:hypothetical protein